MTRRWTAGVERTVLGNGLTVLVKRDTSAPVVAAVTHVKAGFFDEPDRWAGISHVLEHMYFKGTPRRGPGAIARETKAAGGYLNASTSYDRTSYFVVLPASGLATALDIQADALQHAAIDREELARELQVIIQEAKRKLDTPSAVTQESLFELMFDRHRIRRWRIGTEEALAGFTREDVWGYYRSRYVPHRTIVSIVGDVDPLETFRLVERAYGGWAPGEAASDPSPAEPERRDVRARTLRGDVANAELALGWRTVSPLHRDAIPLDLAAAVLGSGRGSRLHRRLREPGTAMSVSAWHYAPTELGVFSIGADCDPERIDDVLAGVASELAAAAAEPPSAEELGRARTLFDVRLARRLESMEGQASTYASAEALGGLDLIEQEHAAMHAATPAQVCDAIATWLRPDAVSAVAYLPRARGADVDVARVRRAFGAAPHATRPAPLPALTAPAGAPSEGALVAGVLHLALPGADVLVARKAGTPLVTLGIYALRPEPEAPGEAGIGVLAMRAAVRGAGDWDAATLAGLIERLGGGLAPSVGTDTIGVGTTVLAEHLGPALQLLSTVFHAPTLEERSVAAERSVLVGEAEQAADDMFRFPFQLAFGAAFGDVGYGVPVAGRPDSLRELAAARVRAWHADTTARARPVVIAVGDVEPHAAAGTIAAVVRDWSARPAIVAPDPFPYAFGAEPVERVVTRDKAQSAFAMVFAGPGRADHDRHAADVWSAIASGLGGRLFDALRDRRSLAYTVVASAWQRRRAGALLTYIATGPDREQEARDAMLEELARFAREPVSTDELTRAVEYLAGQHQVARQSAGGVAGEILDTFLAGEPLAQLESPAAGVRAVTREQVQALAARAFEARARAEGVVRGSGGGR